jgi:hypothetical protein
MSGPKSLQHYKDEFAGGLCNNCETTMKMVHDENGFVFICSKKDCNATARLIKEDFLNLIEMERWFYDLDIESEKESGLMMAYPDWDPDEMDIDTYREKNGLD